VSKGYHDLAKVINKQKGDSVKAEMLIREALRIRVQLYDNDHLNVGSSSLLLAYILQSQGRLGHETKAMLECSLRSNTKHYGPDGKNTAVSNFNLGGYYYQLAEIKVYTYEYIHLYTYKYVYV
jgi:hypothetical protein